MSNPGNAEGGSGPDIHSGNSGFAHSQIDVETGGEPSSANNTNDNRPRSWRLDFDLNFDPTWLVSHNGTGVRQGLQGPLSMLNDWVRNSIPGNTPATLSNVHPGSSSTPVGTGVSQNNNSTNPGNLSRRESATSATGAVQDTAQFQGQPLPTGSGRSSIHSVQGRRSSPPQPPQQSLSIENPTADPEDVDSEAFVVDMGPATNWANPPDESRTLPGSGREPGSTAETPASENAPSDMLRLRQSPEARALIQIIERYTPFVIILFIKGIFDHGSGILCFLALLITFSHANSLFKKEVAKQSKRNVFYLAMIVVNLLICIIFMYYIFDEQKLYLTLAFMRTTVEVNNIWALLWIVGVTDYIAKFLTIIVKCMFLALPEQVLPFQKRGKYYLFVEQSSQLYRSLLPLHPYFIFLFDSYDGTLQVFGFILTGVYVLFKLGDILQRLKAWKIAFGKLLQQVHYGCSPTTEQMANAGQQCPICHDVYVHPTRLSCTHIFCEECVSTWFDRERTCPMCRAKVVDDPAFRDGSTTHFIQLF